MKSPAPIGAVWPGRPYPRGATWDGEGVNFALFSETAEKVELCIFDPAGRRERQRIELRERTDAVWHCYLPEARPGLLYGYRVHGPYKPEEGLRFNPHKLLADPYAKDFIGNLRWSDALYGYTVGHKREDLSFDRRDSAAYMPKSRVLETAFTWGNDRRPDVPWHETVIYEMHVRGFTMRHPEVPQPLRGSYAGLATAPVIEYLKRLGVTTVELLPVHAFIDDRRLFDMGLRNYWGYNTLGFFAPETRYSASGKVKEFKTMVRTLHTAGIEVILDVVYNHTCEGNHLGPTLSLRGIDNAAYYRLAPDARRHYMDFTGCGNTINLMHPRSLQLVMDSLRYWVEEMHVDGFRFDLASALAREDSSVDLLGAFFDVMRQDPVLNRVKLIAEPWDIGHGGYQVGNFPLGWAEWNDRYRDGMRAYWKGDGGTVGEFARRLTGSSDLYGRSGRNPYASINFITAHDGFTLADLVSLQRQAQRGQRRGQPRRPQQQPVVELRRRGPDRRPRDPRAARAPAAQLPRHPAPVPGRADAARRRRARAQPAGQQQRLLPGQRDQLARLDAEPGQGGLGRLRRAPDRAAAGAPDLPPARLLRGPAAARRRGQGHPLAQARRRRDERRRVGARIGPQPGRVPRRRRPDRRRPLRQAEARRRLPDPAASAPRGDRLRAADDSRASRWRALFDTAQEPATPDARRHYAAGETYTLRARSLVLLTRPAAPA